MTKLVWWLPNLLLDLSVGAADVNYTHGQSYDMGAVYSIPSGYIMRYIPFHLGGLYALFPPSVGYFMDNTVLP